jgi:hypothetical protein
VSELSQTNSRHPHTTRFHPHNVQSRTFPKANIMKKRQQNEAIALLHASEFATDHLADFNHEPLTKVDVKYASARTRLTAAVTALGGKHAIQTGGAFSGETERQHMLREDLHDELEDVRATADSISSETANPALMERFRMPDGKADSRLAAKARAFATAIREFSLNDEFEAHGHGPDTAAELEDLADELDGSEGGQSAALGEQAGATASIPEALRNGKAAIKTLHAIVRRVYKNNPAVLAAWEVARHIQRTPRPEKETPPAPNPA